MEKCIKLLKLQLFFPAFDVEIEQKRGEKSHFDTRKFFFHSVQKQLFSFSGAKNIIFFFFVVVVVVVNKRRAISGKHLWGFFTSAFPRNESLIKTCYVLANVTLPQVATTVYISSCMKFGLFDGIQFPSQIRFLLRLFKSVLGIHQSRLKRPLNPRFGLHRRKKKDKT